MKKILALVLAVVFVFSMTACGTEPGSGSKEGDGLKIAIVSSPSGVDDGSFNQDNYNGVLKFIEENEGATVTPIREESGEDRKSVV